MAPSIFTLSGKQISRFLAPYIFLLAVGLLGRWLYPPTWFAHEFLGGVFDACAIAGILAIVIELFSAKHLIEHVSDDLAGKLLGRGLPRPLQEAITKIVLKTDFVMFDYLKAYRFMACETPGYFDIELTISYYVLNYSDVAAEYSPHIAEEGFYNPRFIRLEYGVGSQQYAYGTEDLAPLVKIEASSRVHTLNGPQPITLQPIRDASPSGPGRCEVLYRLIVRMKDEYSDVSAFGRAAVGAAIRFDSVPPQIETYAGGPGMVHDANSSTWRSLSAFTANQHLRAWWLKRPPTRN